MPEKDPLAGGREVSSSTITFGKVGDFIKGTYVGKKLIQSKSVYLYELKGMAGVYHTVDGKKNPVEPGVTIEAGAYYQVWGGQSATSGAAKIDELFKKSRFGDIVAIRLDEEVESKTKGNAPFKKYRTLEFGVDPEYAGESSDMVIDLTKEEETPFN